MDRISPRGLMSCALDPVWTKREDLPVVRRSLMVKTQAREHRSLHPAEGSLAKLDPPRFSLLPLISHEDDAL